MRRLPVYILVDCSESMAGEAIESVNKGLSAMISELRSNPSALETVFLSVITFSDQARQVVPLTDLISFQLPPFSVRPGTALGGALALLADRVKNEVVRTSEQQKGDYRPLAFLLTDGQPTDHWEAAAQELRSLNNPRLANLYAIGCGSDVDSQVLYKVTDIVLNMPSTSAEAFRKFFVWLSASVQSASMSVGREGTPLIITPPKELMDVAPINSQPIGIPRQVFLHVRCQKTKKPYLMRYKLDGNEPPYIAVCAHPLEEFTGGTTVKLPPVNAALLMGCPPCPYCENTIAGKCPCGQLFCSAPNAQSVVCPSCGTQLTKGTESGNIMIDQSAG